MSTKDEISKLSKKELERRVRELEGQIERRDVINSYKDELMKDAQQILYTSGYIFGVVSAGFGETTPSMLKNFGEKLGGYINRFDYELSRMEVHGALPSGREQIALFHDLNNAMKAMYNGTDPSGEQLKELAAHYGGIDVRNNIISVRPQIQPGAGRDPIIDRLCTKIRAYILDGYGLPAAYDAVVASLENSTTTEEKEELQLTTVWGVDHAKSAYKTRYGSIRKERNIVTLRHK